MLSGLMRRLRQKPRLGHAVGPVIRGIMVKKQAMQYANITILGKGTRLFRWAAMSNQWRPHSHVEKGGNAFCVEIRLRLLHLPCYYWTTRQGRAASLHDSS